MIPRKHQHIPVFNGCSLPPPTYLHLASLRRQPIEIFVANTLTSPTFTGMVVVQHHCFLGCRLCPMQRCQSEDCRLCHLDRTHSSLEWVNVVSKWLRISYKNTVAGISIMRRNFTKLMFHLRPRAVHVFRESFRLNICCA